MNPHDDRTYVDLTELRATRARLRCPLEVKARDMLSRAYPDDPQDLLSDWVALETALLDHMAAEEEVVLPGYAARAPRDAERIFDEHTLIRALVTLTGVDIELHAIRTERLQRLVDTLHDHSASEDRGMYPWATANLALATRHVLFQRIGRSLGPA